MMEFIRPILKNKRQCLIILLLVFLILIVGCRNDYSSINNEQLLDCVLDNFIDHIPEDGKEHVIGIGETTGWTDSSSYLIIILKFKDAYGGNRLHAEYRGYDIYYQQGHMLSDSVGVVRIQDVEIDTSKRIASKLKWKIVTSPAQNQSDELNYELHPFKIDLIYDQNKKCVEILNSSTTELEKSVRLNCNVCATTGTAHAN